VVAPVRWVEPSRLLTSAENRRGHCVRWCRSSAAAGGLPAAA